MVRPLSVCPTPRLSHVRQSEGNAEVGPPILAVHMAEGGPASVFFKVIPVRWRFTNLPMGV